MKRRQREAQIGTHLLLILLLPRLLVCSACTHILDLDQPSLQVQIRLLQLNLTLAEPSNILLLLLDEIVHLSKLLLSRYVLGHVASKVEIAERRLDPLVLPRLFWTGEGLKFVSRLLGLAHVRGGSTAHPLTELIARARNCLGCGWQLLVQGRSRP